METNNGLLITAVAILAVIMVIGFMAVKPQEVEQIDQVALKQAIVADVISAMPLPATADEIAAKVKIPEWEIPKAQDLTNEKLDDLWKDLYGEDIDEVEEYAYDYAMEEFEDDDYEFLTEWFEENVEDFDEILDVDEEDCDVEVLALGLEEDEDKEAEVVCEFEVEYNLLSGMVVDYKKTIFATANVFFEEGDFDDEEVVWTIV